MRCRLVISAVMTAELGRPRVIGPRAAMESFFSSPKTEYNQPKPTLFWHSTIGYMSPMEFDPQIGLLKRVSSAAIATNRCHTGTG